MDGIDASPGPRRTGHGRIDDIEVLRAVAVGMVLVQHLPGDLIPWVSAMTHPFFQIFNFWSGVDLFLAISGFVIARSLLPMLAEARSREAFFNSVLSFWVRRAWRLQPTAWLWGAIMLVCAGAFNRSGVFETFQSNVEGAIAAILNVANIRQAYVLFRYPDGVTGIFWTLSLEEQFYVTLPFLVYFAGKRLPLALAIIVAAQLFVQRSGPGGHAVLNVIRSDALSLGVLLAIWSGAAAYRRFEPKALRPAAARWLLTPAFIVLLAAASGPLFVPEQVRIGVVALLSAAIVWVASYDAGYLIPSGGLKRVLCWMGGRSYALYLIHLPVYFAAREFWHRLDPSVLKASGAHAAVLLLTALPLIFLLADLNYRFVELPLRRRGARIAEDLRRRNIEAVTGLPEAIYA